MSSIAFVFPCLVESEDFPEVSISQEDELGKIEEGDYVSPRRVGVSRE